MIERKKLDGVAVLLVDIQYDFIDGSLAVPEAEKVIPQVKQLLEEYEFSLVAVSQDYHPAGHVSFASSHRSGPGTFNEHNVPHPNPERSKQGETVKQMLWPDHCVQGTRGVELHSEIVSSLDEIRRRGTSVHLIRKGTDKHVDGYSAFADNQYLGFTDLSRILFSNPKGPIHTLVVVGLATDYCVKSSAIDACKFKLKTILIEEAMRGVAKDTTQSAMRELKGWGVRIVPTIDALAAELI